MQIDTDTHADAAWQHVCLHAVLKSLWLDGSGLP